jgi:hypothetical protein
MQQQRVALPADVSEPLTISAGLFSWNRLKVARHLPARVKPFHLAEDQHKR